MHFIAIHTHEYGSSVKLFNSDDDAEVIFNALPNPEFGDEDEEDALTSIDFAKRINIDFEPEKGETLSVERFDPSTYDTLDFSDFKA